MILNYYVGILYQHSNSKSSCTSKDDFELTPSNPGSYMQLVREGKEMPTNSYAKVNSILTEILCANGTCPIF